jgi:hypothetical protein
MHLGTAASGARHAPARSSFRWHRQPGATKVTEWPEFKTAEELQIKLSQVEARLEVLRDEEVGLLNGLTPGDPVAEADWLDADTMAVLEQMSSSQMPVGRVALGTALSRDNLIAQIGWASGRSLALDVNESDFADGRDSSARRGSFGGVRSAPRRPTRLLDLIPSAPMDGASFDYVQELGIPSGGPGAAETAEGSVKPHVSLEFLDETAYAETIAVYTKIRKQAAADSTGLTNIVSGNLMYRVLRRFESQILAGAGHASGEVQGLLNMTGVGDVPFDADELPADQLLEGIVDVLLSDAIPNVIAINPRDWSSILKGKADDGHYFSALAPFIAEAERVWSVTTVPSPAVEEGAALVGDTSGATILIREGVKALVSDSDQDDFVRNRLTVLAEMRGGLAVWRPEDWALVHFVAP